MDDVYYYLGRLEEAYSTEFANAQERLAIHGVRIKLEAAILNVEVLLTQLISQKEGQKK